MLVFIFAIVIALGRWTRNVAFDRLLLDNGEATYAVGSAMLFNPLYRLDVETVQRTVDRFLGETNIVHAAVRDRDGQVVAATTKDWRPEDEVSQALVAEALARGGVVHREVEDYLVLVGPIAAGAEQIGTLELVLDSGSVRTILGRANQIMVIPFLVLFVVALVLVTLLARSTANALRALIAAAGEIGSGNLERPIPVRGFEESAQLGLALESMRTQLQKVYVELEQQVAGQEHRANRLRTVAEVAQEAAIEVDMSILLQRVVRLITRQFGFYYAGILMVDESGDWAELRAASGVSGQRMLAQGYRLRVGQEGLVGYAISEGKPQIVQDVEVEPRFVSSPELPDTRAIVALPLQARGEIMGALDVRAAEPGAFGEGDIEVLYVLANQVALALGNARLFLQVQESLQATRRTYGELSREAWDEAVRGQRIRGYHCDASGVVPVAAREHADGDDNLPAVSVPLTVRGLVIGSVDAHKPDGTEDWSPEEVALLGTLVDQLEVALDSARLYQDTQRRAVRDRMIADATGRMRETLEMESVIRSATEEIVRVLDLAAVDLRLTTWVDLAESDEVDE
jgi:GAF domain-containing protein/uncharacterized membrane protein affecting hemolysin expression